MAGDERDARARLRAAWDAMLADLARARDALDDPALHPAPPSPRNLAEGYRYLMSQLYCAIERGFFVWTPLAALMTAGVGLVVMALVRPTLERRRA